MIFDPNTQVSTDVSKKLFSKNLCSVDSATLCSKSEVIPKIIAIKLEDSYTSPEPHMKSSNTYKSPKTPDSYNGIYKAPAQKSYTYGSLKPIMNAKDSYGNPVNSLDNMYVIYKTPLNAPGQGYRNRYNLIDRPSSS